MVIAREGTRVVRGPDWSKGDEDQGEGHLGTVKVVNSNKTVDVLWDKGELGTYSTGKENKNELRVFDNAAFGQPHTGIRCGGCQATNCMGIIWACQECPGIYLCNTCYCGDQHDIRHRFKRIDNPGKEGVAVSKRSISYKVRSSGMFIGAKVKRLHNCAQKGDENLGKVTAMVQYDRNEASHNALKVTWSNNETSICRPGDDVICVEEMPGLSYYRDHLPLLSDGTEAMTKGKAEIETGKQTYHAKSENNSTVNEDTSFAHRLQNDDVIAKRQPESSTLKVGDNVRVIDNVVNLKTILKEKWSDDMADVIGRVGKISQIYTDGSIEVDFGNKAWVFSPACCEVITGEKTKKEMITTNDPQSEQSTRDITEHSHGGTEGLNQMFEKFSELFPSVSDVPPWLLFDAAAKNNAAFAFVIAIRCPYLVNAKHEDFTPLMIASQTGHIEVIKILLKVSADVNIKSTKGVTALMLAINNGHEQTAVLLLREGADINQKDTLGRSAMHFAAYKSATVLLKELINRSADPNAQDEHGNTPLHICIMSRNLESASDIVKYKTVNLLIRNKHGQTPLLLAALNNDIKTIEDILKRCPVHTNSTITNGALQAAAFNNHTDAIRVLIKMGANVNDASEHPSSPLHLACLLGNFEISKLLTEAGARVNTKDTNGVTPLHLVCASTRSPVVNESQIAEKTNLKKIPDNVQERTDLACFLVKHGADVLIKDALGRNPLDTCIEEKMKEAINHSVKLHRARGTDGNNLYDRLFSQMPVPCVKCMNIMSDIRMVPCGHAVLCRACAFGVKECPRCKIDTEERFNIYRNECDSNTA